MMNRFLSSWVSVVFMVLLLVVVSYIRFEIMGPPYYF